MWVWLYIVILLTLIVFCMFLDPRSKSKTDFHRESGKIRIVSSKKGDKRDADK